MHVSLPVRKSGILILIIALSAVVLAAACTQPQGPVPVAATPSPAPGMPTPAAVVETPAPTDTVTPSGTTVIPNPQPVPTVNVSPEVTTPISYLTYTNSSYGFSIDYPSDWEVVPSPAENGQDPGVPRGFSSKTDVVEFYSPAISRCTHGECVDVRAEMHVEVDLSPPEKDLDQYYIKDVAVITKNYPLEITAHNSMIRISDHNAFTLDYHAKIDLIDIRAERVYSMIGGKAYVLTYHAHTPYSGEPDLFEKYSNVEPDMLRSFHVTVANKAL